MFKISFFNGVYYLLIKYIIFSFFLAFIGDRFKNIVINNAETTQEVFKLTLGYVLYILFYIVILILLFCAPLYYILKIKKGIYFLILLIAFYVAEFFIYTQFFSPSDKTLGIYNTIIGILLMGIFFYKSIRLKLI